MNVQNLWEQEKYILKKKCSYICICVFILSKNKREFPKRISRRTKINYKFVLHVQWQYNCVRCGQKCKTKITKKNKSKNFSRHKKLNAHIHIVTYNHAIWPLLPLLPFDTQSMLLIRPADQNMLHRINAWTSFMCCALFGFEVGRKQSDRLTTKTYNKPVILTYLFFAFFFTFFPALALQASSLERGKIG